MATKKYVEIEQISVWQGLAEWRSELEGTARRILWGCNCSMFCLGCGFYTALCL